MGLLDLLGSVLPYSVKPWEWQRGQIWSCDEMPDMTGKVIVCTGANGGEKADSRGIESALVVKKEADVS